MAISRTKSVFVSPSTNCQVLFANCCVRDPQNVMLHLHHSSRELSFNALLELRDGGSAVLAVEAAGIVHQDDVVFDRMPQDGFKFAGQPLLVALQTGPAVVAGVEPEERWRAQSLQ